LEAQLQSSLDEAKVLLSKFSGREIQSRVDNPSSMEHITVE
jgi:hypothetical protein